MAGKKLIGMSVIVVAFFVGWSAHRVAEFKMLSGFKDCEAVPVRDLKKLIV